MKIKALILTATFFATSAAMANGGLSIDNVNEAMNADAWVNTQTEAANFTVQGPIDAFDVEVNTKEIVDTNRLKHSNDQLAGQPNFIYKLRANA